MMKPATMTAILVVFVLANCSRMIQKAYFDDPGSALDDNQKSILFVPIASIITRIEDNTKAVPDTEFSDSFFIEAINGLVPYELSRHFRILPYSAEKHDSLCRILLSSPFSSLHTQKRPPDSISARVRELASSLGAELIAVPHSCEITHQIFQPRGWRGDRYAGYYERPITYTAQTRFHVQIWTREGRLLYERTGAATTGKPIMYSAFKKKQGKETLPDYAKHFFAPPLIKSLSQAIRNALVLNQ
jgi:hypothetical protein